MWTDKYNYHMTRCTGKECCTFGMHVRVTRIVQVVKKLLCEICGSHGCSHDDYCFLVYYVVYLEDKYRIIWHHIPMQSNRQESLCYYGIITMAADKGEQPRICLPPWITGRKNQK
jgi:hypothetical protein